MSFNAEYVGTSDAAIYRQEDDPINPLISDMSEAFYSFLVNYSVRGAFPYRYSIHSILVMYRDQIVRNIVNGENYLNINLDDFQVYDSAHQYIFQQSPGLYLQAVCAFLSFHVNYSLRMQQRKLVVILSKTEKITIFSLSILELTNQL